MPTASTSRRRVPKDRTVNVRLPGHLFAAVADYADAGETSLSHVIREALLLHLRPDRAPRARGAAPHGRRAAAVTSPAP